MTQNNTYDAIVIGAGPNGLTCGAYLAKAGAKTLILEKKWETGGGLSTDDFQTPFRFNLHAVYMMLADWAPANKDLELDKNNLDYLFPDTQLAFHYKDNRALVFYRDPVKSAKSIADFSEKDAETFQGMYAEFKEFCDEILIPQTYVSPIPAFENLELLNKTELGRRLVEVSEKTPEDIIDHYGFEDDRIKSAMLYLATLWGLKPDDTGVGYLVPLYIYRMMNAALVRGGSHTLSSAIHNAYKLAGGQILEWSWVDEIILEDGKAVGVRTKDGREFRANAVISTLDPEQTFLNFMPEDQVEQDLVDAVKNWQWEDVSLYTAHYGIKGNAPEYKAAAHNPDVNSAMINVFGVEKPEDVYAYHKELEEGKFSASHGHATCTTYFDPHQASCSDLFGPLHTLRFECWAPYELNGKHWDDVKREYSNQCYELWKSYCTNLDEAHVLFGFSYSPVDIERRLIDMKRGSFKQGAYNLFQMGYLRPNDQCSQNRTPVEGLYVGGASVYPGGMILLGSGYLAAQSVAEDLNLDIWWSSPDYVIKAREKNYIP